MGRALVVGIGRFDADASGDEVAVGASAWSELPFVDEVVPPVVAALNRLGYATDVHRDVGAAALRAAVDEALGSARVVYVASHGDASADNPYRVDVVPADACVGRGTNVAEWVDDAHRLGNPTLFLLDLCRSGRATSLPHMVHSSDAPANAWVIAASSRREDAYDGRFSIAVTEVLEEVARTGLDTDPARSHVPFSVVARRIRRRVERMPGVVQNVQSTAMVLAEDEPDLPFFPNPAHNPDAARLAAVDPALRVFLDPSDARHFTDKAGTRFTGRRSQLRLLAPWLDDVDAGGLRVVTGNPGVGKSALLGALACAAHPELVAVAPHVRERLDARDASACPSVNDLLAAVHARGRPSAEVFASMACQLGLNEGLGTPIDVGMFMGMMPQAGEVPAVIVDALDESSDPAALCADLVRLAHATRPDGTPAVRLLVGTRPWPMFTPLLDLAGITGDLVNLDEADPDEVRDDVADHINACLADVSTYAPPSRRTIRHHLARAIAEQLTPHREQRAAWGAFLVAEVFTRYVERVPVPNDVDAARALGRSVPTTLPAVLDLDLAGRSDGPGIRAVLSALAQARGEGMPLEVALPMAELFADLDPDRARSLLPDALFYLRAVPDHDGTLLYRLFHQGLVDHLTRQPTNDTSTPTPGNILDHLLSVHTNLDGHTRTWDIAPPYLLRHAPAHAEAAGRLDELLLDTEYLVHGDPAALVTSFPRVHTDDALLARAVYRTSIGVHRHSDIATRRRLLAMDATRHDATILAQALAERTKPGTWTVVAATGGLINPACRDTFTGHSDQVNAVACTMLDRRPVAVTGAGGNSVWIWDLATGSPRGESLTGHTGAVLAVACTVLDGRPVAITGAGDHTVRLWDLTTGQQRGKPLTGHTGVVHAVACTTLDGCPVAVTGASDNTVRIWDLTTGQQRGKPLAGHTDWVRAVACTVLDGRPVAVTGADDHTVRLWDLTTGSPRGEPLTGHTGWVNAVACTVLDGRPVAVTGADDHTVRLWDLTIRRQQHGTPIKGHFGAVRAVTCTVLEGRPVAVTGADDNTVRIWDLTTRRQHREPLTGHTSHVKALACTMLDERIVAVTGAHDRTVRLWDLALGKPRSVPPTGHTGMVRAVACTVLKGRHIAVTGADDHSVRLWNLTTGQSGRKPLTGHRDLVRVVACTLLEGRPVAVTGADDTTVRVWDLATGRPYGDPLTGHTGWVRAVACTTLDERIVAVSGASDNTLRIWDLATGGQRGWPLTGHTSWVNAVACTTLDGRPFAVTGADDHTVRLWDLTAGRQHGEPFTGHTGEVNAVACTTLEGRPVAVTGADDHTVRIWDLNTGRQRGAPLIGHIGAVRAVACTVLDGRPAAVTGADDHTVRIWDLTTRTHIDRIPLPAPCSGLAVGNKERLFVSFGVDVALLRRMPRRPSAGWTRNPANTATVQEHS
ncbi:AAA family ATPase [Embleya scabrispora]|uniref:AAA family ATPase n=1 Tax=Embleya scabrispora TaxID=159449 RepID=UPI00117CA455|nr:caspase family protein [Embleya scabrispora]